VSFQIFTGKQLKKAHPNDKLYLYNNIDPEPEEIQDDLLYTNLTITNIEGDKRDIRVSKAVIITDDEVEEYYERVILKNKNIKENIK
jgi:hypothetical protein